MPGATIYGLTPGDDPRVALEKLLAGAAHFIQLGETDWALVLDDDDPDRAANRRRQARYRAQKRNARNGPDTVTRNAEDTLNSYDSGGVIRSLSPPPGEEREIETPERNARNGNARNAGNAVTRNADELDDDDELREMNRRKIRELSAQFRATRERG
jgi:hypothetical protein